jgi:hypothetical protein
LSRACGFRISGLAGQQFSQSAFQLFEPQRVLVLRCAPVFVAVATAAQRKKVLAVAAERMATPVQRSHNQRSASSFTLGDDIVINMFTFGGGWAADDA